MIALPPRLSPLIGREDQMRALASLLDDPAVRLVTLTGPGGVGKTRLALEAGYATSGRFAHVHFVPLAAIAERRAVFGAIARAIGVAASDSDETISHVQERLQSKPALILLDTMEHVISAAPDIDRLIERIPTLTVLLTSREALRLPIERVVEVEVLATPPEEREGSVDPTTFPAIRLFVDRVQRFDPTFTLDARTTPAVVAICQRLDGLPLAIELAAARVKLFSLSTLQDRLAEQIDVLGGGPRDQPAHQRTMRATIAWSYALLTLEEQTAFRVLAWFDTPFTQAAARALLSDAGIEDGDLADTLIASLIEKHLLRFLSDAEASSTFIMFKTIRVFGREMSRQLGEEQAQRNAHANWVASFAIASLTLRPDGTIASPALATLSQSYPDIERVLAWFESQRRTDALLDLVIALSPYWTHRFGRAEGRHWIERALALASPSASETTLARAELELAALSRTSRTGDPVDAIQLARRSLARYQRLQDRLGMVAALNTIGVLQRAQGELDEATKSFQDALAQTDDLGHPWWQALLLCNLGATALWQGETREARQRLEEAVRSFRTLEDQRGIAFTLHLLALVRCAQGEARTAASITIEGLEAAHLAEAMETSIDLVAAAGVVAAAGGEFAPAIRLLEGADSLSRRALYRIERPERDMYEDWRRIARRALGLGQAERHLQDVDQLTLDEMIALARTALERVAHQATEPLVATRSGSLDPAVHGLTVREHQVLALMAQRYTDREIAETLQISVRTVSRHVSNIFAKLGLRSRRDVLTRAPTNPEPPTLA